MNQTRNSTEEYLLKTLRKSDMKHMMEVIKPVLLSQAVVIAKLQEYQMEQLKK